jgi:hypothetical protein
LRNKFNLLCIGIAQQQNGALVVDQDKFEEKPESAVRKPRALSAAASPFDDDHIATERQALRDLLDSLKEEPETLLEQTLNDTATRHNIGRFIGHTMVKPYEGEQ